MSPVYAVCALVLLIESGERLLLQSPYQHTRDFQQCAWEIAVSRPRFVTSLSEYLAGRAFELEELMCLTEHEFNRLRASL